LVTFLGSKGKKMHPYPESFNDMKYPLFVTWLKNGDLRGCIGTFAEDEPFGETLMRYSLIAAV
jgi:AMMECR1 domain-containing protein